MRRPLLPCSAVLWPFVPMLLHAQSFVNSYGGALAQDGLGVTPTPAGFVVGVRDFSADPARHSAKLLLISNGGTALSWTPIDGIPGNAFLQTATGGPGGSLFIAGSSIPAGDHAHNAFARKFHPDGTIAWTAQQAIAGDEQYHALAPLPDGGAIACGVRAAGAGHDAWVTRFAADGTVLWNTALDDGNDEEAHAVAVTGNDVILTGRQRNSGGTSDAWFARINLDGNTAWTTSWGGGGNESGRGIVPIAGNAFLMVGTTNSQGTFDVTEGRIKDHVYLVAIGLDGDSLWTRAIGDTLFDRRAFCLDVASNGDLLIGGERSDVRGKSDALVCRVSSTGQLIWERAWHIGKEDRLLSMRALPDGFVTTGWSFTEFARQVLLIRRNPNGN